MALNKTNKSNYDLSNATTMLGNAEDVTKQAQQYQVQAPKFTREYGSMSTYINPENKRTVPAEVVKAKKKSVPESTKTEVKKPRTYMINGKPLTYKEDTTILVDRGTGLGKEEELKLENSLPTNATDKEKKEFAKSLKNTLFPKEVKVYTDGVDKYGIIGGKWYKLDSRPGGTTRSETEYLKPLVKDSTLKKVVDAGITGNILLIPGTGVPVMAFKAAQYLMKDHGDAVYMATPADVKSSGGGGGEGDPDRDKDTNLMPEQKAEEKVYELPDQYKALRMAMASQKAEPINIGKLRGKQGILEKITEGALQGGGQAIADKLRGIQGEIEFDKQIAPQLERTYGARFRQSGAPDDYLKTLKESGTTTYASPENKTPEEENKAIMMEAMNLYKMIQENAERQDKLQYAKELIAERAKYYKPNQASLLESTIIQALTKNQSK